MNPDHLSAPLPRFVTAVIRLLLCALCSAPAAAERLSIRTFSAADGLGSSFVSHIMQDSAGYVWFSTRDGLSRWNGYEFTTLSESEGLATPAIDFSRQTRSGEYFVIGNDGSIYSYLPAQAGEKARKGKVVFRRRSVQFNGHEIALSRLYQGNTGGLWGAGQGVLVKGVGSAETVMPLNGPADPYDPSLGVSALLEDRAGSLWIGTNRGLFRLLPDGNLIHYALGPQTAGDSVKALTLDEAGRVWIGYRWLGVVVFAPSPVGGSAASQRLSARTVPGETIRIALHEGEAIVLTTANGLPDNDVTSLVTASDGQIWIGTARGLARFDGTSFARYTKDNGLCDNIIHSLFEDRDGNLWVATPTGAMRVVLKGFSGYTVAEGLATDRIVSIGETPGGAVYAIGIDWSINTFDGRRFRASRLPLPKGSSLMWASQAGYRDREGRWWALTNQGFYRFAPARAERLPTFSPPDRVYTALDGLPGSQAFRLYQDRSGSLWLGTRSGDLLGNGLARFDATLGRAVSFGPADGLPPRAAPSAFAEDRQGSLWIGFYQGGIARYRAGRFTPYTEKDGIPQGMVTGLLVDRKGRLWISTNQGGIGRVDEPSTDLPHVRRYSIRDGLASNNARALVEDRDGRIFVASVRGVDRLDPATGRIRHYGIHDGLAGDFVVSAFCDSRGDLWFGTYGGVSRLRPDREEEKGQPPIAITGLRVAGESYPVLELGEQSIEKLVLDADQRDIAIDFVSVSGPQVQGTSYQYSIDATNRSWSRLAKERSVNFARLSPGNYLFAVRAVTQGGKVSRVPATVAFTIRPPFWQRWWVILLAAATLAAGLLGLYRYRVRKLVEMERLRMSIASDLHDDIATNLSSIAMFSTLVRNDLDGPSPFLDRITTLATESVEAIREIIWAIDPKPETIASLLVRLRDAMVTPCRARGIHLIMTAPTEGMDENLTPEQRKDLWLMLKEAVSNAVNHSGGTELWVSVVPAGKQVRISVRDNGGGLSLSTQSPGRGLDTMRRRAESLGGTAAITSVPGEGTTVEFLITIAT